MSDSNRSTLGKFARDDAGNFIVMGALCAPLVLLAMGGAVDISNTFRQGTNLQSAVDAAALAVARRPADMRNDPKGVADAYFVANYESEVTLKLDVEVDKVVVEATVDVPTPFLSIMRTDTLPVTRKSEVTLAQNTREIALVLDTTGSMSGKKLSDMKAAATRLVEDVVSSSEASDSESSFALVPFSAMVNAGLQTNGRPQPFIDDQGRGNGAMSEFPSGFNRLDLFDHLRVDWKGCILSRSNGHDVLDSAPDPSKPDTLFEASFAPDEPDTTYFWGLGRSYMNNYLPNNDGSDRLFDISYNFAYNNRSSPTGTLLGDVVKAGMDRNSGNLKETDHPLSRYGVKVDSKNRVKPMSQWTRPNVNSSGPNASCEAKPVIPLTTQAAKITTAIKALDAVGSTNIVEGAAWGWRTLSPGEPFREGRPYEDIENDKIMVLLTDGTNDLTMTDGTPGNQKGSAWSSYGHLWDGILRKPDGKVAKTRSDMTAAMDARLLKVCENAKKAGINIFTILLEVDDAATSNTLRDCATTPTQFYDARDSNRLADVFEDIRGKISRLRISR